MARAAGVLTSFGGLASHAAVIARGWGVPAVVSATDVEVGEGVIVIGAQRYPEGVTISIDGSTGQVYDGAVTGESQPSPDAATLVAWARQAGLELPSAGSVSRSAEQAHAPRLPTVTRQAALPSPPIKGTAPTQLLAP